MNRIDRLFGIVTILQSRKYVSAEHIAEKFNISIRTVYRDIKAIQEQGIPLSFEQGKGYFIVDGYFLRPVSFNMDEANALLLVENLVKGFADISVQNHYSSALTKIKSVLKSSQKEKLLQLNQHIKLQLPKRLIYSFDHLSLIQNSITEKNILIVDYKNIKEETTCREVEPIGLVFYAFNWHLIAWCHTRNDYRDFNLSRVIKIKNLDKPFKIEKHMQLSEYMKLLPVDY